MYSGERPSLVRTFSRRRGIQDHSFRRRRNMVFFLRVIVMWPLLVYVDTCVFGGAFDSEFASATAAFFEQVRLGRFGIVVSALVRDELDDAPVPVQELFAEMLNWTTVVLFSVEALELQQAYLDAGVLTQKWADDALHVAMATGPWRFTRLKR